jgi:hypothetical protein
LTGAGNAVVQQLAARKPPDATMKDALREIFNSAEAKGVGVLIDAEQHLIQEGIDAWALGAQEQYNHGKAVIYSTYQAYLQSAPATLARHLAISNEKGFMLGVKLVRGAYLGTDPPHIFWRSKAETDQAYDSIAEALIRRKYNHILKPYPEQKGDEQGEGDFRFAFPETEMVLATHNHDSVRKAMKIRNEESKSAKRTPAMAFAQLMGMADEVSCELIMSTSRETGKGKGNGDVRTYKYLPWGTVRECLGYLTRRAEENRQAVERAQEGREALRLELTRRVLSSGMTWRS